MVYSTDYSSVDHVARSDGIDDFELESAVGEARATVGLALRFGSWAAMPVEGLAIALARSSRC